MMHKPLALMLALCALGWAGAASADDETRQDRARATDLDITMRVIEDPDAVGAESITRRITLPSPPDEEGEGAPPPGTPANGPDVSELAREGGREFGEEIAEQARELAEQAGEQREEFGRSRAEELRPDLPERPDTDPPVPPRP